MCNGLKETIIIIIQCCEYCVKNSMLRRWLVMLIMTLVVVGVRGWGCVCDKSECETLEPSGCPGLGVEVWDICRCCKVCARTLGEPCGEFSGTCEPGLKCDEGSCTPIT